MGVGGFVPSDERRTTGERPAESAGFEAAARGEVVLVRVAPGREDRLDGAAVAAGEPRRERAEDAGCMRSRGEQGRDDKSQKEREKTIGRGPREFLSSADRRRIVRPARWVASTRKVTCSSRPSLGRVICSAASIGLLVPGKSRSVSGSAELLHRSAALSVSRDRSGDAVENVGVELGCAVGCELGERRFAPCGFVASVGAAACR